jgi:hypothetical protein
MMAALLLSAGAAIAQPEDKNSEGVAVLELGAAASCNLKGGSSFGPSAAVEFTPIDRCLELEAGVTPLFHARRSAEWNTDLLFKKPWTLSKKAEFMFGAGPEWVHTRDPGAKANSVAGEAALDFMFWPSATRRFGWYVEPAYDYNFARGHERSIGVSAGLLITIPNASARDRKPAKKRQ